jgi:[ribosomal protein S18]-alanine N-acetyltransferase
MAVNPREAAPIPEVSIRPMRDEDVADVVRIEQVNYRFPWTEGIFRDCLRVGYGCTVLELGYVIAGYAIFSAGAGEAHLLNICVRPEFRCRGLGRRLLEHLLREMRGLGARVVFLEVRPSNVDAIRLYEVTGFTQIGIRRGYYQAEQGREDAIVMRLMGPLP